MKKNILNIDCYLMAMKTKLLILFFMHISNLGIIIASEIQVNGIYYDFDSRTNTATVTYRGFRSEDYSDEYFGNVVIPANVIYKGNTYSVKKIGVYAFRACTKLTSITIPHSVTSIEYGAFLECKGLTSVIIPDNVTSIGELAFCMCTDLISVKIPNNVNSIGKRAFMYCTALTSVTIPNSVISIGEEAFYDCLSLLSISVPNNVASIGDGAFYGVNNVIYYGNASGKPWRAKCINGYVDGELVYSDASKKELLGCSREANHHVNISESVTTIGEYTFSNCVWIRSTNIPNSVTAIKKGTFFNCVSLLSITIPNSVTSIGEDAFYSCTSLASVTIPYSVTSIEKSAFEKCANLKEFHYPQGLDLSQAGIPSSTKLVAYSPTNSSTNTATASSRSTSDTNSATTSRTASSSTTSQSTTPPKNTYTKPTTTSRPICTILSPKEGDPYSTPTIRLEYKIENLSGVESVKFYVNGIERKPKNKGSNKGVRLVSGTEVELEMPTENGKEASISIVVVDVNGDERIVGRRKLKYVSVHKPTLHVFAVGVNKYKAEGFTKLDYAEQDAKDFTNVIMKMADKNMYKKVDTTLILGSVATTFNLQERLTQLSNQVEPNDVVMIFSSPDMA